MGNEGIEAYLASLAPHAVTLPRAALARGLHPFVTISRAAGSGAGRLADALLRQMHARARSSTCYGWRVVDSKFCAKILRGTHLRPAFELLLAERYQREIEDLVSALIAGRAAQSRHMEATFRVLRTLAIFGKVIIVETGGACLTRDLPCGVHVRLLAAPSTCLRRTMGVGLSAAAARRVLAWQDRARARLWRVYFHEDIHDPMCYDATWNTDSVSFDQIAASILQLVRARASKAWRPTGRGKPGADLELPFAS
jgi:hypothetical protein